uniref:Putative secreted protein n=1 Tax=Anopheles darlingi TaxID=43151 RepID=A0A2M4DF24_ANODA
MVPSRFSNFSPTLSICSTSCSLSAACCTGEPLFVFDCSLFNIFRPVEAAFSKNSILFVTTLFSFRSPFSSPGIMLKLSLLPQSSFIEGGSVVGVSRSFESESLI